MVTTARMRPLAPPAARPAQAARPAHAAHPAGRGAPLHGTTLTSARVTPRQLIGLIAQGTLVGALLLGVLAAIWFFFGDALRASLLEIAAGRSVGGAAPAGPGPTVFSRDRGDGTVVVMEIDGNGTRVRGVIARTDVPLLQADKVREGWGSSSGTTTHNRVNALGSSFR